MRNLLRCRIRRRTSCACGGGIRARSDRGRCFQLRRHTASPGFTRSARSLPFKIETRRDPALSYVESLFESEGSCQCACQLCGTARPGPCRPRERRRKQFDLRRRGKVPGSSRKFARSRRLASCQCPTRCSRVDRRVFQSCRFTAVGIRLASPDYS